MLTFGFPEIQDMSGASRQVRILQTFHCISRQNILFGNLVYSLNNLILHQGLAGMLGAGAAAGLGLAGPGDDDDEEDDDEDDEVDEDQEVAAAVAAVAAGGGAVGEGVEASGSAGRPSDQPSSPPGLTTEHNSIRFAFCH